MQNIIIPQSLEQRVSWKTTLDAIILSAGIRNKFTLQVTPVLTDATPGVIEASYYRFNIRAIPFEDKVILKSAESIPIPPESKSLTLNIDVPSKMWRGYYLFQLVLEDEDKAPIGVFTTYAVVDSAIEPLPNNYYMSLESVRTQFADISFDDNRLLESQEIGTWDICEGVKRAIEQWNNTAPRLTPYMGHTFPYPEILRRGVIYMVLQSLWTMLERNRMQYAAGNASVDLEKRADAYGKLKEEYRALWSGGMAQAKNQENIEAFNLSTGYV